MFNTFRSNVVCTVVTLKICLSFEILSFPSLAISKDFIAKTTMTTAVVIDNTGPFLTAVATLFTNFVTNYLANVVRAFKGVGTLLSKVLVVVTLCSVGLHVVNGSGIPLLGARATVARIESF